MKIYHEDIDLTDSTAPVLPETQLLLLADTCLLWGHRLSEWCGHGPALEEDIALTNTALDVIGQARALLQLVATRRGDAATEDTLAYFREPAAFGNLMIAALPNQDYAFTIARSFLLSAWFVPVWEALGRSTDRRLADIASAAVKESRVQLRHAGDWVIRFGDGTDESHRRIDAAFARLWPYCDEIENTSLQGTDQAARNASWRATTKSTLALANLARSVAPGQPSVSVATIARESRAELLAEMQSLARQHPGAGW